MSEQQKQKQQNNPNQPQKQEEKSQNQGEKLSEADKQVYNQIFQSLSKIDKKVQSAKSKLNPKPGSADSRNGQLGDTNTKFKQIAQKLIDSKENSEITNKQDLMTDINQSFERAVVDIYSQNQKLKKKMQEMEKIIHQQNHKIFQQQSREQTLQKEIQKLHFELAQQKDDNLVNNRQGVGKEKGMTQSRLENSGIKQKKSKQTYEDRQINEDYDFWNMPQNDNYSKKKKQFVESSGLWVNQQNGLGNQSMFITESKRRK